MSFIDYYKILGLSKKATEKEIKAAYRKLARKYHPDLNPGDKEAEIKFKQINEANEVLSDPENRKKYDHYGKDWRHAQEFEKAKKQQKQQSSYQTHYEDFSDQQYSDFFESMFGGRGTSSKSGRNPRFRGQDYHAELNLDLDDVYTSQKQVLTVNGQKIRLTIPAGVENGQEIRIKGKGGKGISGGPDGDLYIRFNIGNRTPFKREGDNLYRSVDLDLYKAILGGELTIDTFRGKAKVKIRPGTANGTKVKLAGKGFPVYKNEGKFGDLIITFNVLIPNQLNDREKALFKELQKIRQNG